MKEKLIKLLEIFEKIIAFYIIIAVLLSIAFLAGELWLFGQNPFVDGTFNLFLGTAFNVIIGIEFLKMLFKHTPGAVIEVLLFTISRQLVVEHSSVLESLLGAIAIAGIFFIRKYLYVKTFTED